MQMVERYWLQSRKTFLNAFKKLISVTNFFFSLSNEQTNYIFR